MSDPFLAEIRIFPFNFPPTGWAWCNGQLMPLSQNTALFALLGTTYGGDGKSTFALPDLRGRAPMHPGQGPGLSPYDLGQSGGADAVPLIEAEMPAHSHNLMANAADPANVQGPSPEVVLARSSPFIYKALPVNDAAPMAGQAIAPSGGSLPHNNLQPYLTVSFCIALQGIFPPRP